MKKSMKKLSIVFLAACVALSAAACGGGQTESSGTAGSTASGSGTASENKPITLTALHERRLQRSGDLEGSGKEERDQG